VLGWGSKGVEGRGGGRDGGGGGRELQARVGNRTPTQTQQKTLPVMAISCHAPMSRPCTRLI
jgi:hypothetical protein